MGGYKVGVRDLADLNSALPSVTSALTADDRVSRLTEMFTNSLVGMPVQRPSMLDRLSPTVRKRVEALRAIQSQHDELQRKFIEEKAVLEAKYQKLYEPLYVKRYEIVNGVDEVEGSTDERVEEHLTKDATEEKGVPDFWLTAMKTNEVLAEEIQEHDEGALKFLKDIRCCRIGNPSKGFKLEFFFDLNPYFKNSVLTKTYHMSNSDDDPVLEKAVGTQIEWYPGKCLTQKVIKKKPKKGSKNTKPIIKTENCESFFNFFSPPQLPEVDDEDDDDDIDGFAAEQLENLIEQDYDIGSTFRDKIIPRAVLWFAGEAYQEDDYGPIDDNDDEEENDNDGEEEGKTRKKGGPEQGKLSQQQVDKPADKSKQ
ncbi:nucleosome assembly protein 1 [Canna indica]|uniref:Nucleosome assembly protein 1 n=1 Tax=Canna indica TaxID=4628 RepID=A0AAQ3Q407_9LILI|nr:nucleosome assembly protein 1 [Canna indica]